MAKDYFMLVFITSCGVYQIAAVTAKLEGLWFFGNSRVQYIFGILAIIGAFGWFYTKEERNIQHSVEGSQQLGLFLAAIITSYIATVILSSIIQARISMSEEKSSTNDTNVEGFEDLKNTTVFDRIVSRMRKKERIED